MLLLQQPQGKEYIMELNVFGLSEKNVCSSKNISVVPPDMS